MIERVEQQIKMQHTASTTATKAVQQTTEAAQETQAAASELKLQHATDRVEISEQGYASLAQADTTAEDATKAVAKAATEATAKAATEATKQAATEATEQAGSSSTTNLTSLSEDQLEKLVTEGSISRAQADTELARRQGGVEE